MSDTDDTTDEKADSTKAEKVDNEPKTASRPRPRATTIVFGRDEKKPKTPERPTPKTTSHKRKQKRKSPKKQ